MGVAVREKDGAWWVFICHQGKRKAKRVGDKKAAEGAARILRAKLTLGDLKIADPKAEAVRVPTFEEVAKEWERHAAPAWKQGTVITYGNALRTRLLPTFGTLPMPEVTAERVEAWWTGCREEKLSKKHLGNLCGVLRGVCRRAVRLGLLATNPAECIEGRLGRSTEEVKSADYLTPPRPGGPPGGGRAGGAGRIPCLPGHGNVRAATRGGPRVAGGRPGPCRAPNSRPPDGAPGLY